MAEKTLGILIEAKNLASGALAKVTRDVDRFGGAVKRSHALSTAFGVGIERVAEKGISVLFDNVRSGIDSLHELERQQLATSAVIQSTGGKAGVTAAEVRKLAEAQEALTTVDDKTVQAGENMLLTFTGIGKDVFPEATRAMVNMAIAMNQGSAEGLDLKSTAIQIGKALNDPIKGVTALRKVGVALTEQQQKDIKSLVKQGKTREAQLIILKELETEFGKAGAAAGKGGAAIQARFNDAIEDAQMALAEGLLPVIEEVQKEAASLLSDPKSLDAIRGFGKGVADVFREGVQFAKQIPWGSIADAMKLAGQGAKAALDMFTGLPPWVQTAVVTGWGLNKLSGGALGGIIGELGKGLIKGVLGMNAGVVNINAGVVNGPGGIGGKGGPLGALGGTAGFAAPGLGVLATGIGAIVAAYLLPQILAKQGNGPTPMNTRAGNLTAQQVGMFQGLIPGFQAMAEAAGAHATGGGRGINSQTGFGMNAQDTRINAQTGFRMAQASDAVSREVAAVRRISESTAPSQKSAEAHLAQLKALQASTPARETANTAAIVAAIRELKAVIARPPQVNVNISAADIQRVQNDRRRTVKPHGPRGSLVGANEFG